MAVGGLLNLLTTVPLSVKWVNNHKRFHNTTILDELVHVECLELACTFCNLSVFRGRQLLGIIISCTTKRANNAYN